MTVLATRNSTNDPELAGIEKTFRRVLLVEDNDDDREQIAYMIRGGFGDADVKAVATGTEALDHFQSHDVDCVILDYRLEAEDGLTILAEMKSGKPYCPVIMLTGQGNEEVAAKSIKVGAADYLIKQRLTETYLESAIENAISRSALEAKVAEQESNRKQFLNTLVHDLRAPLRNIGQLGDMAVKDMKSGDISELEDLLNSQKTLAYRATALINTLEDYALLDREVSFGPVSLTNVVEAAHDNLATLIIDRHAVVDFDELPMIHGHQPQLIHSDSDSDSDSDIIVTVKDNGIGIPEKHLLTIFAPLRRLWGADRYEGTGLGLALCQKIVERHGGSIWCTSIEGEGSQFHVRLPSLRAG